MYIIELQNSGSLKYDYLLNNSKWKAIGDELAT